MTFDVGQHCFSKKRTINMTSFSLFPFMIYNEVLWE
ncbi:hypothetical protein NC651_003102 [Populus alba x Populus x berolinensis]|nr:hypothetical protein NC651_003102 [Populus alba x Populus x berolinensis]